jgi:transcriptional regulator with XRE-family HTH domain
VQKLTRPTPAPAPPPPAAAAAGRSFLQAFGRRLTLVRVERGLSQRAIADALAISDDVISKYERGQHAPKLETLQRLGAHLAVSLDYLLGGTAPSGIKDRRLLEWARAADQLPAAQRDLIALSLETMVHAARRAAEREPQAGGGK